MSKSLEIQDILHPGFGSDNKIVEKLFTRPPKIVAGFGWSCIRIIIYKSKNKCPRIRRSEVRAHDEITTRGALVERWRARMI